MQKVVVTFIAALFLQLAVSGAFANSPELSVRVLGEFGDEVGISQICCSSENQWQEQPLSESFRTRYGGKTVWIKIEGISESGLVQFSPILDSVTLYVRESSSSEWQSYVTGDTIENERKFFSSPFMALPLPQKIDHENVFARIDMPVAVTVNVRQWNLPEFNAMQDSDRTLKTYLLGFICAIVLYNIVVAFLVRDAVFLINALCIGSLLLVSLYLSGYGAAYIWAPWATASNVFFYCGVMMSVTFGSAFFYLFLRQSNEAWKGLWPLMIPPILAIAVLVIFTALSAPYWMLQGAMLASAALVLIIMIITVTWLSIKGEKRARLLAIPLIGAVVPGVVIVALNKVAGINLVLFENNTMETALALEGMLFSFALASRIRISDETTRATAKALLEERVRSSAKALAAQDNERKRLSSELHDGVGQELLLVISKLKRLVKEEQAGTQTREFEGLIQSTSSIMESLRRISRDMHPASVEHFGLDGAIEDITSHLNASGQIDFSHDLSLDQKNLNQQEQVQIMRIVQECVANVVRHSGATKCEITMRMIDDNLQIRIEDDGIGIADKGSIDASSFGLGMTSIDERVRGLGGQWRLTTSEFGGLATIIEIPPVQFQPNGGN